MMKCFPSWRQILKGLAESCLGDASLSMLLDRDPVWERGRRREKGGGSLTIGGGVQRLRRVQVSEDVLDVLLGHAGCVPPATPE